ncbi:Rhodanese-related sulfurtransferase [Hymenobacter gelipurpurascens]|uniref:Rhodanese-related sulfurtransferase n=1 Tax=Hymenobacter gelipurpurascens TaxID=89968 RepID=A0A212TED5_9BACT|nr:rhodanese-like domain-containing protein [Hymenobacter gelipurpurascens]SNC64240.1 Rhodanese-related sulfurtransferase [Hymenobacter gelipurpurascens]
MFGQFNSSPSPTFQNLQPAKFAQGVRKPGAVLLDVRRPDEFALGHLPGATNIEVTHPDFTQRVAALDKTQPTYLYCRSGARSAAAAKQLGLAGFEHVFNLIGGVMDWPEPLVR